MKRLLILVTFAAAYTLAAAKDECPQTNADRIYSDAFYSQEAGDVVGYELALKPVSGDSYNALLYIYQGVPNKNGILLTGTRRASTISLEGDWVEELIEYPSKQNTTHRQHVKLEGRLSKSLFRGHLQVDNYSSQLSLRPVNHIWLCTPQHAGQRPTTSD
jgi:hypothetical protein